MIYEEVADIMNQHSVREICRKTGLRPDRIYSLRCGCTFRLDYDLLNALNKLGYDLEIKKKSGKPDN